MGTAQKILGTKQALNNLRQEMIETISYLNVLTMCSHTVTGAGRLFASGWETSLVPVSQPGAPIPD